MTRSLSDQGGAAVDLRPHGAGFFRPFGQRRGDIKLRQRFGRSPDCTFLFNRPARQILKQFEFAGERSLACACNLGVKFGKLGRGEPNRIGIGLSMDEARGERGPHQRFGLFL